MFAENFFILKLFLRKQSNARNHNRLKRLEFKLLILIGKVKGDRPHRRVWLGLHHNLPLMVDLAAKTTNVGSIWQPKQLMLDLFGSQNN